MCRNNGFWTGLPLSEVTQKEVFKLVESVGRLKATLKQVEVRGRCSRIGMGRAKGDKWFN
jgi:hypothetical protein